MTHHSKSGHARQHIMDEEVACRRLEKTLRLVLQTPVTGGPWSTHQGMPVGLVGAWY